MPPTRVDQGSGPREPKTEAAGISHSPRGGLPPHAPDFPRTLAHLSRYVVSSDSRSEP